MIKFHFFLNLLRCDDTVPCSCRNNTVLSSFLLRHGFVNLIVIIWLIMIVAGQNQSCYRYFNKKHFSHGLLNLQSFWMNLKIHVAQGFPFWLGVRRAVNFASSWVFQLCSVSLHMTSTGWCQCVILLYVFPLNFTW